MDDCVKRKDVFSEISFHESRGGNIAANIRDAVRRLPAADVVEVVRCQDCKYCNSLLGKSLLCLGGTAWKPIKGSDYCAWGERRTNNG